MDSPEKRIVDAAGIIWTGEGYWWNPDTRAGSLFEAILHHARQWDWLQVEMLLDRLYDLVGGENLYTGYAFHCGKHPLQEYISSNIVNN